MDTKVFITNLAGHDFESAEKYGELTYITRGFVSLASLDRLKIIVMDKVKESKADDWLLLSGASIICVTAALIWYKLHKRVKILVYDGRFANRYREITITEKNLDGLLAVYSDDA